MSVISSPGSKVNSSSSAAENNSKCSNKLNGNKNIYNTISTDRGVTITACPSPIPPSLSVSFSHLPSLSLPFSLPLPPHFISLFVFSPVVRNHLPTGANKYFYSIYGNNDHKLQLS